MNKKGLRTPQENKQYRKNTLKQFRLGKMSKDRQAGARQAHKQACRQAGRQVGRQAGSTEKKKVSEFVFGLNWALDMRL